MISSQIHTKIVIVFIYYVLKLSMHDNLKKIQVSKRQLMVVQWSDMRSVSVQGSRQENKESFIADLNANAPPEIKV